MSREPSPRDDRDRLVSEVAREQGVPTRCMVRRVQRTMRQYPDIAYQNGQRGQWWLCYEVAKRHRPGWVRPVTKREWDEAFPRFVEACETLSRIAEVVGVV